MRPFTMSEAVTQGQASRHFVHVVTVCNLIVAFPSAVSRFNMLRYVASRAVASDVTKFVEGLHGTQD